MKKVNPHYIAGLFEGEGCFSFTANRDAKEKTRGKSYYRWRVSCKINLLGDGKLLEMVRQTLKCGTLYNFPGRSVDWHYTVNSLGDLEKKIIPFFDKYPMLGRKKQIIVYGKRQFISYTRIMASILSIGAREILGR